MPAPATTPHQQHELRQRDRQHRSHDDDDPQRRLAVEEQPGDLGLVGVLQNEDQERDRTDDRPEHAEIDAALHRKGLKARA